MREVSTGSLYRSRRAWILAAVQVLALFAAAIALPSRAPAGQSSQATATPALQVAAGVAHSCAILASASLRCWGFSGDGQVGYGNAESIGDNETPGSVGPVDVGAGRTVAALAAGDYHTCAVLDNGTVRCWGYGYDGQLGYANRGSVGSTVPPSAVGTVDLGAGRTATAITAGGRHTCAILDNGRLRCWGQGENGQLGYGLLGMIGDNETPGSIAPVDLGAGRTATAVTAGGRHTCAIRDTGDVKCWGVGGNGQLGYADTATVQDPGLVGTVNLGSGRTARAITAGDSHTCAVLDDFSVRCWGLNESGQLGYGNTTTIGDNEAPGTAGAVDLGQGRSARAISAGGDHTCAVLDNGSVRCWGQGVSGELGNVGTARIGDNELPGSIAPVGLGSGRTATAISAGVFHTCARLDDASVRCWGYGGDGRLGHCAVNNIGDDETPGSIGVVDLGAGGAACPAVAPPPPPPPAASPAATAPGTGATDPPAPPVAQPDGDAAALAAESKRAEGFRACRAAVLKKMRSERSSVLRRYRRNAPARVRALRGVSRRAAQGRLSCLKRFARIPGRVTSLAAKAEAGGRIVLTFPAPGSDGSKAPAARTYLVKQSLRPIRTARDFQRAPALCNGGCSFEVTKPGAVLSLSVTQLRRNRTYYYQVAARDNVSKRTGPRSAMVQVKTK